MGVCEIYLAEAGLCLVLLVFAAAISRAALLDRPALTSCLVSRVSTLRQLSPGAQRTTRFPDPGSMEW